MTASSKAVRSTLLLGLLLVATACGTGPDGLSIAGTWSGVAQLPNPFTTTLSLTQSGNTIGGSMQIASVLNQAFVGTFEPSARSIDWQVFSGCEEWTGVFTVTSDGSQMSGPVQGDYSNCSSGSDVSGTISVSKQ